MTRMQVLKEALGKDAIDWLNSHESLSNDFMELAKSDEGFAKELLKLYDAQPSSLKSFVQLSRSDSEEFDKVKAKINKTVTKLSDVARAVALQLCTNNIGMKEGSKITKAVAKALEDVLVDVADDEAEIKAIQKDLNDKSKKCKIAQYTDKVTATDLLESYTGKTREFLFQVYDIYLTFGHNVIGKGEIVFALVAANATLCNHTSKNNKSDVYVGNRPVEIKANNGSLSGSGAKNFHTKVETVLAALKNIPEITQNITALKRSWLFSDFPKELVGTADEGLSPFSQKAYKTVWSKLANFLCNVKDANGNTFLQRSAKHIISCILQWVYTQIYVNNFPSGLDGTVSDICDLSSGILFHSAKAKIADEDIRRLLAYDTAIKSIVYLMSVAGSDEIDTNEDTAPYLVLCNKLSDKIIMYVIDYGAGAIEDVAKRWSDLVIAGKLKPQARNSASRGAANSVAVKEELQEALDNTTEEFCRLLDLDPSYVSACEQIRDNVYEITVEIDDFNKSYIFNPITGNLREL